MRLLSKFRTLYNYAYSGIQLGEDLRSKWLLASMLMRMKWQRWQLQDEQIYQVWVRLGSHKRRLLLRATDIFIVYEVLWQKPYIYSEMKQKPPRRIVDLGAHIGLATLAFKAEFPDAEVHCYEPDPENFQLLSANTQNLDGIVLHQEAVGVASGKGTLYIRPGRHSASSLVTPEGKTATIKCVVSPCFYPG